MPEHPANSKPVMNPAPGNRIQNAPPFRKKRNVLDTGDFVSYIGAFFGA